MAIITRTLRLSAALVALSSLTQAPTLAAESQAFTGWGATTRQTAPSEPRRPSNPPGAGRPRSESPAQPRVPVPPVRR